MKPLRSIWSLVLVGLVWACGGQQSRPQPATPRAAPEQARPEEQATTLVVGAILPVTGSGALKGYGDVIRQGIDIAIREHERAGGRKVELVVVDDGGDPARASAAVAELEARHALAIVGPLLSASLEAAGRARSDSSIALISPTSTDPAPRMANVYTLNTGDTRGAEQLGGYVARGSLSPIGVLYPRTVDFTAQAQAFMQAVTRAGVRVAAVPFDSSMTTFSAPLQQLRRDSIRALFIPASGRVIRQLAPQLRYYGLNGVQVLGSEAWVSEEVLRSVPARLLEGVVAATPLYRSSPAVAWEEFVGLYEGAYRRTLASPYPALGYDAAKLILASMPQRGRVRPADVARAISRVTDFRGATGVLSTRGGTISRRPFIVRIQAGRPVLAQDSGS